MAFGTLRRGEADDLHRRFQSLFFWNGLWDGCGPTCGRYIKVRFQSLFFWNGLWDVWLGDGNYAEYRSFNPCFSGMAFGTPRPPQPRQAPSPVSILVFLEWPLGPQDRPPGRRICRVSILVFLEWPLGPYAGFAPWTVGDMFQSLFFWNGLWDALRQAPHGILPRGFNPCFSGMAFGTPEASGGSERNYLFQSLFFWNGLWDHIRPAVL